MSQTAILPTQTRIFAAARELFDENGKLTNDPTRQFLKGFIDGFAQWIERISGS